MDRNYDIDMVDTLKQTIRNIDIWFNSRSDLPDGSSNECLVSWEHLSDNDKQLFDDNNPLVQKIVVNRYADGSQKASIYNYEHNWYKGRVVELTADDVNVVYSNDDSDDTDDEVSDEDED